MSVRNYRWERTARNRASMLEHRLLADGLLPTDLRDSLASARAAQRFAQRVDDGVQEAYSLNQQAVCLYQLGRLTDAFVAARLSQRKFRYLDHTRGVAAASYTLGILCHIRGRTRMAVHFYRHALDRYERAEDLVGECRVRNALGNLSAETGAAGAEAIAEFTAALAIARRVGDRIGETLLLRNLAIVHQERREHEEALRRAKEALALCRSIGLVKGEAGCLLILGEHWMLQREFRKSRACLRRSLRLAIRTGSRFDEVDAFNGLGRLLLASGQPAAAMLRFRRTLSMARALGNTRKTVDAMLGMGQALAQRGEAQAARKLLRQTAEMALAAGQKGIWKEARRALGALRASASRPPSTRARRVPGARVGAAARG